MANGEGAGYPETMINRDTGATLGEDRTAQAMRHAFARCILRGALARWQQRLRRRHRAARVIQRRWTHAIVCPDFEVCRKRLRREFEGMQSMMADRLQW